MLLLLFLRFHEYYSTIETFDKIHAQKIPNQFL